MVGQFPTTIPARNLFRPK